MAVLSQNQLHRPILEILDSPEVDVLSRHQLFEALAECLSLSKDDLGERFDSGQTKFEKNTEWALYSLKQAGLLDYPSRGYRRITSKGSKYVKAYESDIEGSQLKSMTIGSRETKAIDTTNGASTDANPDEQMRIVHNELNVKLADDLLEIVREMEFRSFERLVVRLLEEMGYGKGQVTNRSNDGGIDGIIDQDRLGLDKVHLQAKCWRDKSVGAPVIDGFAGSLGRQNANKGVFITTSSFTTPAKDAASQANQSIRLIDGAELALLMIEHDLGVVNEFTYTVKQLDKNFFTDEF